MCDSEMEVWEEDQSNCQAVLEITKILRTIIRTILLLSR